MPLTKIQKQERAKRNQNRLNMMGMRQPPGTKPMESRLPEKLVWQPMHLPRFDVLGLIEDITNRFTPPWMRRRRDDVDKKPVEPRSH